MSWSISSEDRDKYEAIFHSLSPQDGKLLGETVRPVLMKSNLDIVKLCQIWSLSDVDQDGMLNLQEFLIAMHLTYKTLGGTDLPEQLPLELQNSLFGRKTPIPASIESSNNMVGNANVNILPSPSPGFSSPSIMNDASTVPLHEPILSSATPNLLTSPTINIIPENEKHFCVTPTKFDYYVQLFDNFDNGGASCVSAADARSIFIQSGLPNSILAEVWNLADSNQRGALSKSEFVLSMQLLAAVLQGYELPTQISEHMVRAANGSFTETECANAAVIQPNISHYSNNDHDPLKKELAQLQNEVNQMEMHVSNLTENQKNSEDRVSALYSEIESKSNILSVLEAENASTHNSISELDQTRMKIIMDKNELSSKHMTEVSELRQLEIELMNLQSGGPSSEAKSNTEILKSKEDQLKRMGLDVFNLLNNARSEKNEAQQILDKLEICDRASSTENLSALKQDDFPQIASQSNTELTNIENLTLDTAGGSFPEPTNIALEDNIAEESR